MKNPKVSLIIPCYNSEKYIQGTIDSVRSQTMEDFECIIVNDASTDQSKNIIQENCKQDRRIKYVEHRANSHVSAARNTGIRLARGRYLAFLDSDDLLTPESLQDRWRTCEAALRHTDKFAGSYSASIPISEDADSAGISNNVKLQNIGFVTTGGKCPFNANQPMVRAEIIRAIGGFSEALSQAEDYNLWLMILRAGYWFAPSNLRTVTYRKREHSLVRTAPTEHLNNSMCLLGHSDLPLPQNHLTAFTHRLSKGFNEYEKQKRRADRILEFCGITLAVKKDAALEALKIATRELPNLTEIFPHEEEIKSKILSGIIRAKGKVEETDKFSAINFIASLAGECAVVSAPEETKINEASPFGPDSNESNAIWNDQGKNCVDVAIFPHKDYHVWTISLFFNELKSHGIRCKVVDISGQWRNAGVREAAKKFNIELIGLGEFIISEYHPKLIVSFNDWDHVTRPIIVAAKNAGIPTMAIVEGIQDYNDADTGRIREAYRTADTILLPGDFDKKYFSQSEQNLFSVGIPRIESMRHSSPPLPATSKVRVLINSNFSYGVQEDSRDEWVRSAIRCCIDLGMEPVLSRHPADSGTVGDEYLSNSNFYDALSDCHLTIQRFASGILEALAFKRGVIYFNPHGEEVDKFTSDPMGAYVIAKNESALKNELQSWEKWVLAATDNGQHFLDLHAGDSRSSSSNNITKCIKLSIDNNIQNETFDKFYRNLRAIDLETGALCHAVKHGRQLFDDVNSSNSKMDEIRKKHEKDKNLNFPNKPERPKNTQNRAKSAIGNLSSASVPLLASRLLIAPAAMLPRVEVGGDLSARTAQLLSEDNPEAAYLHRVLNWARREIANTSEC
ncbi:glycosyltransferase [Phaeobacter gallaeciensis]|uniref:glycosyltransferase n=1 Tax=Phaeobacter gallaeciensis TaxID=60890 RepID=UPI00237F6B0F|nr:glycosyltransferase [Phaeobacter gallaeciensis]MDE4142371.1 glycosyltransferase [Phaeobacter gallaeciensis]MDE4150816.1 glycosyltransferase [Phaeobacter gallaeciensis]MDE4155045.1 glycosyltransferase [Phaeobacter gallaeciensis]MDE4230435.1 glycosyltransferase [Phaeobacter gallaeciensis]MDE4259512.1 glycosyltransferase [Phaeobacter gallaeciensis]